MKLIAAMFLFVAGICSAAADDFESSSWPGEGVPGFASKRGVKS